MQYLTLPALQSLHIYSTTSYGSLESFLARSSPPESYLQAWSYALKFPTATWPQSGTFRDLVSSDGDLICLQCWPERCVDDLCGRDFLYASFPHLFYSWLYTNAFQVVSKIAMNLFGEGHRVCGTRFIRVPTESRVAEERCTA
jgi:hypothetical protein